MRIYAVGFKEMSKTIGAIKTTLDQFGVRSMPKIAKIMMEDVLNHFEDAGADVGGWAPHAPATVKRWGAHPLLILQDIMRRSFRPTINKYSVYVNSNSKILGFHNYGTRKMPQREVMYLSAKAFDTIFAVAVEEVDIAMRM